MFVILSSGHFCTLVLMYLVDEHSLLHSKRKRKLKVKRGVSDEKSQADS